MDLFEKINWTPKLKEHYKAYRKVSSACTDRGWHFESCMDPTGNNDYENLVKLSNEVRFPLWYNDNFEQEIIDALLHAISYDMNIPYEELKAENDAYIKNSANGIHVLKNMRDALNKIDDCV